VAAGASAFDHLLHVPDSLGEFLHEFGDDGA
jgi:hypothetical protein